MSKNYYSIIIEVYMSQFEGNITYKFTYIKH
jgi:hypothetical protein